jgi:hypothetical protein
MDIAQVARALGRRGGQARAARLSAQERRRIAALGGHARRRSLELAHLVTENFRYVEAVAALRGGRPKVVRSKTCTAKLPGLYQTPPPRP